MTALPDDWWTTEDVATFLGIGTSTVSAYVTRKQMPRPDRYMGRTRLWRPATIREWQRARPRQPATGGEAEEGLPTEQDHHNRNNGGACRHHKDAAQPDGAARVVDRVPVGLPLLAQEAAAASRSWRPCPLLLALGAGLIPPRPRWTARLATGRLSLNRRPPDSLARARRRAHRPAIRQSSGGLPGMWKGGRCLRSRGGVGS
jgi:predicted DNA-binding transcriptional regulator AlpA